MKKSDKLIWFVISCLLLIYAGSIAWELTNRNIRNASDMNPSFEKRHYSPGAFSEIRARGVWDIQLVPGQVHEIKIQAPAYVLDSVVKVDSQVLYLGIRGSRHRENAPFKAIITCPDIDIIKLRGSAHLNFDNFQSEELQIIATEAATITGKASRIENFELISSGLVECDLSRSKVTNAKATLSGVSTLTLFMNGGDLKGTINGQGKIVYHGVISSHALIINGQGQLAYRQQPQ